MAVISINIRVAVAWWVVPYIRTVALFAALFGMTPDVDKITRTVMRGVRVRLAH
jgi:hypothetical protein